MGRVYDDYQEHRSRLPGDVPRKAGATHIGVFFAWCVERGLTSDIHEKDRPQEFARLQRRFYSGRDYLLQYMEGRLAEEHLGNAGDDFAESYYVTGRYLEDYEATLKAHRPSLYHVPDTWETVDAIAPVLDRRFQAWREDRFAPTQPSTQYPVPEPVPSTQHSAPEPDPVPSAPHAAPDSDPLEAYAPPPPQLRSEPDPGFEIEPETPPYPDAPPPVSEPAADVNTSPFKRARRRKRPWTSWEAIRSRRLKAPGKKVGQGILIAILAILYGCVTSFS